MPETTMSIKAPPQEEAEITIEGGALSSVRGTQCESRRPRRSSLWRDSSRRASTDRTISEQREQETQ